MFLVSIFNVIAEDDDSNELDDDSDKLTNVMRNRERVVEKIGDVIVYAVQKSRQAKSEKNLSLKTPLKNLFVKGKISKKEFESAKDDLIAATKAESTGHEELDEKSKIDYEVEVEL